MPETMMYRLSDSTVVEPLVNNWSAWAHLVSPVASSFHLRNYQLELLKSYLKDPRAHVRACRNPKLRSGRFVEVPEERAAEVMAFFSETEVRQRDNLALADCAVKFHNYLIQEATGKSLDPFYPKLPPELRGYVELFYDYYHRPMMRFFESMLYESKYYKKELQSLRMFQLTRDNARPFLLNTPRLPQGDQIDWAISFESPEVDELFRMDDGLLPLGRIREMLGLTPEDDRRILPLLSSDPVLPFEKWRGPGVRIRYFGHACVLIEWGGKSILTDPCIGAVPCEDGQPRFSHKDLPETIDYALITHNHHDHFCIESLLRLRHKIECLVVPRSFGIAYGDLSLRLMARKLGFRRVLEMDALDAIGLPAGEIVAIPFMGEHADLPHGKTAYVVRAEKEQFLFAADSDCLDEKVYRHISRILGPIKTVFIGMECVGAPLSWSCGPFLPTQPKFEIDQSRRYKGADSVRAMKILEAIGAQHIYVYAMGLEPWVGHLLGLAYSEDAIQLREADKLLREARMRGFRAAELLRGSRELHFDGAGGLRMNGLPRTNH